MGFAARAGLTGCAATGVTAGGWYGTVVERESVTTVGVTVAGVPLVPGGGRLLHPVAGAVVTVGATVDGTPPVPGGGSAPQPDVAGAG